MKTVTIEESGLAVKRLVRMASAGPLILTKRGMPVVAVVPADELDLEAWALGDNPTFMEIIERSRARYHAEGGISLQEIKQRLGMSAASKPRVSRRRANGHAARTRKARPREESG